MSTFSSNADEQTFLAPDPPHWVARGLSTVLLSLFVVAAIASVVVRVPETVRGDFTITPIRGADPVRTPREGTVASVRVADGSAVTRGAVLFVIRSAPVRDREAELGTINTQLETSESALANARQQIASTRASDEAEARRLEAHLSYLAKAIPIKAQQAKLAEAELARRREGLAKSVVSGTDVNAAEQEVQRLTGDLETTRGDEGETRANLAKLRADMRNRALQGEQTLRQLAITNNQARIRGHALEADSSDWSNGMLTIRAPCDGTALKVRTSTAGAVVQAGDALTEIACTDARLQAEVRVPEEGLALLRPGQGVKLLYDAFPYQRFGVRYGVVRWVGAQSLQRDTSTFPFRSLVDIDTTPIIIGGERRHVTIGMGGQALVVVGSRALVSYAFEPLRQLREAVADAPPRSGAR